MTQESNRLHELDSLRGIAAVGVVCFHYTAMWKASPLSWLLAPFYHRGLLLVDFFFVLSGFVLSRAYWNEDRESTVGRNIAQRIARMYPLHFVTLLAIIPMELALTHLLGPLDYLFANNDPYHFVLNLFLLNRSSLERGFSFNAPAWSISTEMIINVAFFLLISCGRRIAASGLLTAFAFATWAIVKHGLITNVGVGVLNPDIVRTTAGFTIGVALFQVVRHLKILQKEGSVIADFVFLLSAIGVCVYMVRCPIPFIRDEDVSFFLFPALIISAISGKFVKAGLRWRPLVNMGEISYSIYLVHFPLLLATLLVSTVSHIPFAYGSPFFIVGFMAIVLGVSSMTYRFIELPGKRLLTPKIKRSASPAMSDSRL